MFVSSSWIRADRPTTAVISIMSQKNSYKSLTPSYVVILGHIRSALLSYN